MPKGDRLHAVVYGYVQGVGFRYFVVAEAKRLGVSGYVRNLPTGDAVEVIAEGSREQLEELLRRLEIGPPGAVVERLSVHWDTATGEFHRFDVRF